MDIKTIPFEYKVNSDDMTFEGYASTFGNRDLVGDVVMKGAFKKTIQERFEQSKKIKILWQHDPFSPIGKPLAMSEDSKGLHVKGLLVKEVEKARESLALMKEGIIDSLSIGYDIVKDTLSDDGQERRLHELKLWEFSLVTFPANPEATLTSVKRLDGLLDQFKGYNFADYLKEGRALSKANRDKIQACIKALEDILNLDPSGNDSQKGDPNFTEFSQLIQDMNNFTKKLKGGN